MVRLVAILAAAGATMLVAMTGNLHADVATERALVIAAERGDIAAVQRLLKAGVAVDSRDNAGRTALLAATHANRIEVARVLIAAGADVNAKDKIQDSPYLYAGAEGRNEILKMTLAAGADLKSVNRYGGTALIPAAHHGYPDTVKILLGTAIDKDHVNRLGWTALLEAVVLGDGGKVHTEIVRLLVEAGANVSIADRDGVTPLRHARQRGFAAMAAILEAAGAR
jgi:ankyrin repeat protein